MNHFFALEIPPEAAQELADVAAQWQKLVPPELEVRWEAPVNYHITLNFLGNISRTQQPRLVKAAAPIGLPLSPFVIHITHLGAFPHPKQPAVLWAGLAQKKETAHLSKQVDKALKEQTFVIEKHSYVPHITLGRCRAESDPLTASSIKFRLPINITLTIDHFALFETLPPEARRNGSPVRYNIVQTFPFGGH